MLGRAGQRMDPISIHALLTESDVLFQPAQHCSWDFNPRSPHGERPWESCVFVTVTWISIHALLTESDPERGQPARGTTHNFNPRSPHGERLFHLMSCSPYTQFQSTLSSRRATALVYWDEQYGWISIHALLTESDNPFSAGLWCWDDFNPRSPHGERPIMPPPTSSGQCISIHALLTESDVPSHRHRPIRHISIHALLTESDIGMGGALVPCDISIHALLTESDGFGPTTEVRASSFQSTLSSRRATRQVPDRQG